MAETRVSGGDDVPITDHSLLRLLQAGDSDAPRLIYERYAQQLRGLAFKKTARSMATRIDPDDIVQSVFRTFFRRAVVDQYSVPKGDELWKLFMVIAMNKIRNASAYHHAAKRDARNTVSHDDSPGRLEPSEPSGIEEVLLKFMIEELLEKFPESSRPIIALRMEGHEIDEIAEKTGRAKRSVERVLQQFRDKLKRFLDECPRSDDDRISS
ncbi:MAG: RNA polymerase sigma factor [Fimbriiglobus sp.]